MHVCRCCRFSHGNPNVLCKSPAHKCDVLWQVCVTSQGGQIKTMILSVANVKSLSIISMRSIRHAMATVRRSTTRHVWAHGKNPTTHVSPKEAADAMSRSIQAMLSANALSTKDLPKKQACMYVLPGAQHRPGNTFVCTGQKGTEAATAALYQRKARQAVPRRAQA